MRLVNTSRIERTSGCFWCTWASALCHFYHPQSEQLCHTPTCREKHVLHFGCVPIVVYVCGCTIPIETVSSYNGSCHVLSRRLAKKRKNILTFSATGSDLLWLKCRHSAYTTSQGIYLFLLPFKILFACSYRQTNWVHFRSEKFIQALSTSPTVVSIHWRNVWHSSQSRELFWWTWTNSANFLGILGNHFRRHPNGTVDSVQPFYFLCWQKLIFWTLIWQIFDLTRVDSSNPLTYVGFFQKVVMVAFLWIKWTMQLYFAVTEHWNLTPWLRRHQNERARNVHALIWDIFFCTLQTCLRLITTGVQKNSHHFVPKVSPSLLRVVPPETSKRW